VKIKTYAMPFENPKHRRVVIYVKDIENITGRKPTAARKLLLNIRKKFEKKRNEFITVREFSLYTGIDEETVYDLLKD
jgi:hypothetical protein